MPNDIQINIASALASLGGLSEQIKRGQSESLDEVADDALKTKQRKVERTYQRPIPTSSTGKPKWERSGDFRNNQTITSPSANVREVGPVGNSENYEERLQRLPTGADGINRSNDAATETRAEIEARTPAIVERKINEVIARLR